MTTLAEDKTGCLEHLLPTPDVPGEFASLVGDIRIVRDALLAIARPNWEGKNWGQVWHRFSDKFVSLSLLTVKAGQRCSMHYHQRRANVFISIDATIEVRKFGSANDVEVARETGSDGGDIWRIIRIPYNPHERPGSRQVLMPAQVTLVTPNVWHYFAVTNPGHVIEVYYNPDGGEPRLDDIVRYDVGCECVKNML